MPLDFVGVPVVSKALGIAHRRSRTPVNSVILNGTIGSMVEQGSGQRVLGYALKAAGWPHRSLF
jgi:hypothetical protein